MKGTLSILTLVTVLLFSMSAMAHEKVVVVPMGSSAKGTDGQVQYNDNGTTAGAEVYYDKATGELEVKGEIRTTDNVGNSRLWGSGRSGIIIEGNWSTSPIYSNIEYNYSNTLTTWFDAEDACPANTWVCALDELGIETLDIQPSSFTARQCNGDPEVTTSNLAWVADAYTSTNGHARSQPIVSITPMCNMLKVWCCRETVTP